MHLGVWDGDVFCVLAFIGWDRFRPEVRIACGRVASIMII